MSKSSAFCDTHEYTGYENDAQKIEFLSRSESSSLANSLVIFSISHAMHVHNHT